MSRCHGANDGQLHQVWRVINKCKPHPDGQTKARWPWRKGASYGLQYSTWGRSCSSGAKYPNGFCPNSHFYDIRCFIISAEALRTLITTRPPYRGANKGLYVLLSRTQAGPGRTVKQEQEEISRSHVPTFIYLSVVCHPPKKRKLIFFAGFRGLN